MVPAFGCRYDADVNIADRWNGTPLTAALRNGHLAIAKMLMSCEAKLGDNADPAMVQVQADTSQLLSWLQSLQQRKAECLACKDVLSVPHFCKQSDKKQEPVLWKFVQAARTMAHPHCSLHHNHVAWLCWLTGCCVVADDAASVHRPQRAPASGHAQASLPYPAALHQQVVLPTSLSFSNALAWCRLHVVFAGSLLHCLVHLPGAACMQS